MYAIIRTGGKQYRVQEGDVLRVEKLQAEVGNKVSFEDVLLIGEGEKILVGADLAKATVSAVVAEEGRGKKVVIFKKRRRKNYRLTKGHRQSFTAVRIESISNTSATAQKADATAE
ncbi:MAG: 50S ribosomal protein L21 [Zetaproteobacteria bacterium CG_4_9_14_3_um_filter_49_83]|nr:MAG: 50S ribosomal protein L21 [Zetaproteobacteria bacterium CG1_02_49_23]PIQ30479.1 MAG: 50S ribosomal protein L21 [Zetaproteobacteria bacterium CG17_big_fil_post_rev_8_21_14_2_50_50_13]PIV31598.1 MAG: 50S ribosomal protein L21 [Zetaproteobacteria bacterium CG02_land_8_20_14_3_00_50_9]PIY55261.1 MAG: 50S ribosomal protein L21 [Zetaproteobacteria bacterium CG_4_10_14_0_8_um_filter_49_80]PJA36073.1 MAG: 50S ribosomal protein L21 [Zetaproteobacteria bacterium CG_4_9_14_3_um_filter_49_83]